MNYPMQQQPPAPPPPPPRQGRRRRGRSQQPMPSNYQAGYGQQPSYGAPPAPPPNTRRKRRRGRTIPPGCIFGCIGSVGVLLLTFLITTWAVYAYYSNKLDDEVDKIENLSDYQSFETSMIYDRNGQELYEVLGEGRRTPVDYDKISPYLVDATVSVEDDTFWENRGVDIPSIMRAGSQYIQAGDVVSGGSTITQQLIRNVLFDYEYRNERSINRKIEEALLAVVLTQRMEKEDILELYLNNIYYGNLAYGIEAASQTYFGKPASELTLPEAALLAGLPQAPAELDPLNPDPVVQVAVRERRDLVLNLMVEEGYITQAEAQQAMGTQLTFADPDIDLDTAPHFVIYAQDELEDLLINELGLSQQQIARGGFRVYTTLNLDYQRLAEDTAANQIAQMAGPHNMNNAAVLVLNPITGEILAMVGSVDYDNEAIDGNVNMAVATRQPGSAMKPFTYAAGMERGFSPATIIWDTQVEIAQPGQEPYRPHNYDNNYHGPVRIREALANSYNIPAVQMLRMIGVDYFLWMMQRMGVESLGMDATQYGPALTLGGGEITPLELTNAYAVLANGGLHVPHRAILCVTNSDNEIIYEYEQGCPDNAQLTDNSRVTLASDYAQQVLDPRIAFVISSILSDNAARTPAMGANSPLYTSNLPTSVKTGTSNDFRDNWTVGYTRNVVVGVWTGNADNTPMNNVSGIQGAAPIWNSVINGVYNNQNLRAAITTGQADDAHLQSPEGVHQTQLCNARSLQNPATSCPPGFTEWVLDTPPAAPDSNGSLVIQAPTQAPYMGDTGPQPLEVEPSIIRVAVFPVRQDYANAIAAQDSSGHTAPPQYCQVPIEAVSQIPGVQDQFFIAPPLEHDDAYYARMYAQQANLAILPEFACNSEMLAAGAGPSGGQVVVANITSPAPGQTVSNSGNIDIIGSAVFSPDQAAFYKVEIQGGPFAEFTTLGDVNNWQNRAGGSNIVLASIMAGALPPGSYTIQLTVVAPDGNWVQQPYQVQFNVG